MMPSADQPVRVLVLGGNGFIGRHVVAALLANDAAVTVGSRHRTLHPAFDGLPLNVAQARLHRLCEPEAWHLLLEEVDVVINCVGILRQRFFETYDNVHHRAPAALATACAEKGVRLVHVSALGLSGSAKSRFLTSKFAGEQAIFRSQADYHVARLSLLDGDGGYGASWLRAVARLPVYVVPSSARGNIAALTAADAGLALARLALLPAERLAVAEASPQSSGGSPQSSVDSPQKCDACVSRVYELGGNDELTFAGYLEGLRNRSVPRKAIALVIPGWLARAAAHLCDVLHFSPFSFGHWELLCRDNVPRPNRLAELLGRPPEQVVERQPG